MTLLTIVQDVCAQLSLTVPSVVVGTTDAQVRQLYALANKVGRTGIAQEFNWQALTEEQTFVTTATTAQTAAIPVDLDRFIPNSFFNRTTMRQVTGPVSPQTWQWLIAQPAYSTVYLMYRQRQGEFLIGPPGVTPPAGETIAYEYISTYWVQSASGTGQASFLADTDTSLLDEDLIVSGVVWEFLRAKGMSYGEELKTFERNLEVAKARDGGSSDLSMAPQPFDMNRANLPDGSFGA